MGIAADARNFLRRISPSPCTQGEGWGGGRTSNDPRYNVLMLLEQLTKVLHAQPFRPFTIHMGDGRVFLVKHRDFISHSPSGRTVIVYDNDDSFSILDMLLVTELEVHPPAKPEAAA